MQTGEVILLLFVWAASVICSYKVGYYSGKIDGKIEREEK